MATIKQYEQSNNDFLHNARMLESALMTHLEGHDFRREVTMERRGVVNENGRSVWSVLETDVATDARPAPWFVTGYKVVIDDEFHVTIFNNFFFVGDDLYNGGGIHDLRGVVDLVNRVPTTKTVVYHHHQPFAIVDSNSPQLDEAGRLKSVDLFPTHADARLNRLASSLDGEWGVSDTDTPSRQETGLSFIEALKKVDEAVAGMDEEEKSWHLLVGSPSIVSAEPLHQPTSTEMFARMMELRQD